MKKLQQALEAFSAHMREVASRPRKLMADWRFYATDVYCEILDLQDFPEDQTEEILRIYEPDQNIRQLCAFLRKPCLRGSRFEYALDVHGDWAGNGVATLIKALALAGESDVDIANLLQTTPDRIGTYLSFFWDVRTIDSRDLLCINTGTSLSVVHTNLSLSNTILTVDARVRLDGLLLTAGLLHDVAHIHRALTGSLGLTPKEREDVDVLLPEIKRLFPGSPVKGTTRCGRDLYYDHLVNLCAQPPVTSTVERTRRFHSAIRAILAGMHVHTFLEQAAGSSKGEPIRLSWETQG